MCCGNHHPFTDRALVPTCSEKMDQLAQAECLVSVANFFLQPESQHQVFLVSASCGGCPPGNTQLQGQHAAKTRAH